MSREDIGREISGSKGAMTFGTVDSQRRLTVEKRKRERERKSDVAFPPRAELKTRNVRETRAKLKEQKKEKPRDKRGSSEEMEAETIVCAKKRRLGPRNKLGLLERRLHTVISRAYT